VRPITGTLDLLDVQLAVVRRRAAWITLPVAIPWPEIAIARSMWRAKSVIAAKLDTFISTVKMNLVVLPASVMATHQNVSSVEGSAKVMPSYLYKVKKAF
jgi:hypothetical protein